MQIRPTKKPYYFQLLENKYSAEKGRGVPICIGSIDVYKAVREGVPVEILSKIDDAAKVKLYAFLSKKFEELGSGEAQKFASELPKKLEELAEKWAAIVQSGGGEVAAEMFEQIEAAYKKLKKAVKHVSAEETTGQADLLED